MNKFRYGLVAAYSVLMALAVLVAVMVSVPPMAVFAATASTSAVPTAGETLNVTQLSDGSAYVDWPWTVDGSGDARARVIGNWVCAFSRLVIDTYNTAPLQASSNFDVYIYEIIRGKVPMTVGEVVVEYDLLLGTGTNLSNSLVNVIELRDQDGNVRFSTSGEWVIVLDNGGTSTEGFLRLSFDPE